MTGAETLLETSSASVNIADLELLASLKVILRAIMSRFLVTFADKEVFLIVVGCFSSVLTLLLLFHRGEVNSSPR